MLKPGNIWKVVRKNSLSENLKLLRMLTHLSYAKMLVQFAPLRFYIHRFRNSDNRSDTDLQPYRKDISLMYRIIKLVPWKVTCLMEVIAFQNYFRRYSVDIPIFVGLNSDQSLKAHAWMLQDTCQGFSKIEI